jgi:hypothetical protein
MLLGDDNKGTRREYELDVKGFWILLKVKYYKISQFTASIYITKIQTFIFDEQQGILIAWAKLKQYCHKAIVADSNLKLIYLDIILFLILSRFLSNSFKLLTYIFIT